MPLTRAGINIEALSTAAHNRAPPLRKGTPDYGRLHASQPSLAYTGHKRHSENRLHPNPIISQPLQPQPHSQPEQPSNPVANSNEQHSIIRKAQELLASDVRADYDTQGEEREREREREERKKERKRKKGSVIVCGCFISTVR